MLTRKKKTPITKIWKPIYYYTPGRMQVYCGSWIRWLVSSIRSCADKLVGGWERDQVQRTAERYDDDGHGKDVGSRLLALAAVIMVSESASPQTNRQGMTKKRDTGENTRSSASWKYTELQCVLSTYDTQLFVLYYRVQGVGSVLSFSAQPEPCPLLFSLTLHHGTS